MPITDFTFNNPTIRDFFDGKSDHRPVSELIYVHSHFVQNNFLSEIETLILKADVYFSSTTKKRGVADKIRSASERLAELINNVSYETAPEILDVLKQIYLNCKLVINETNENTDK